MAAVSTTSDVIMYAEKYWGLDPLFRSHYKFYIVDVLNLDEAPNKSGVFFYGNHPVLKVDIMGVIVKVVRRQRIVIYTVDDGTGVISCLYWLSTDSEASQGKQDRQELEAILGGTLQENIRQLEEEIEILSVGLDLGDLVQIRGKLKCYRGMREVMAKYIRRVTNPMEEASRMLELPQLYGHCYDVPFCPPPGTLEDRAAGVHGGSARQKSEVEKVEVVAIAILSHLNREHIETTGLQPWLEGKFWEASLTDCLDGDKTNATKIVTTALECLEQDGHLVRKHGTKHEYMVVAQSATIASAILDILRRDCPKHKYAVNGCHYLHILDELRKQLQFANVKKNASRQALNRLEEQSDIISTTDSHYMLFS